MATLEESFAKFQQQSKTTPIKTGSNPFVDQNNVFSKPIQGQPQPTVSVKNDLNSAFDKFKQSKINVTSEIAPKVSVKSTTTPNISVGSNLNKDKIVDVGALPISTAKINVIGAKPTIEPMTKWQWISKQLMKPIGTVAAETEALGKVIGDSFVEGPIKAVQDEKYIPGKEALKVLAGKKETSFSDVWDRNYVQPMQQIDPNNKVAPVVGKTLGFIFDVSADPLNFLGGGLTKVGAVADKVSSLTKAGKEIKEGSQLWNDIQKTGMTIEELSKASTKLEQVQAGKRALITIVGKPLIKGEVVYKAAQAAKDAIAANPVTQSLKQIFSTKTGIKEFDDLVESYKNLTDYRKQQVVETGSKIHEEMKGLKTEEIKQVVDALESPEAAELVKSNPKLSSMVNKLEGLFKDIKATEQEKGLLKTEIENYFPHIKNKESLPARINAFFNPKVWSTKLGAAKGRTIPGIVSEINAKFGKDFFQTNPAIAYVQRGLASSKAVTAKDFLTEVGSKFFTNAEEAPIRFIESTNPLLKGLKAEPEIVKAVDKYIQTIKPEELNSFIKGFDKVQNWWKAEVLIAPSYHLRNAVSNFWNNWLAGVVNPEVYKRAISVARNKNPDSIALVTQAGEQLTYKEVLEAAKKNGVLGQGWYHADILAAMEDEINPGLKGIWNAAKDIRNWNPFKQNNLAFKINKEFGSVIENNARLGHFISKLEEGYSAEAAARSVKKYLFDYQDLTWAEKNILKRVAPFYTWTRKNIPLQIEKLVTDTNKFALLPKVIQQIESGVPKPETEKYMSDYIKENVPVRISKNKDGSTNYFMLGTWLPSVVAIDFLSNPIINIAQMVTPLAKVPLEQWSNQSTFFKNSLGDYSKIENYYKQPTEFVGIPMRAKTANLLRNIRVLNEINNFTKSPAINEDERSLLAKILNLFFGKAATYDVEKSKQFYDMDTTNRIDEYNKTIKKAYKDGNVKFGQQLTQELIDFVTQRMTDTSIITKPNNTSDLNSAFEKFNQQQK